MSRLIAAADIGSNTAHLLIAKVSDDGVKRVVNESEWLSLGKEVGKYGRISAEKGAELVRVMRRFREIVDEYGVLDYWVFATEAVRRAENHKAILREVKKQARTVVEIIPPQREAELSILGSSVDCPGPDPMLMVEAGGGSVQVAYCVEGKILRETSLGIGTGILMAKSGLEYPATEDMVELMRETIRRECELLADYPAVARIVACGGVARGLWRAMHPDGDRMLDAREIEFLAWDSGRLTPKSIVRRYDVKLRRAETLLPGALVFREIMGSFGHEQMMVSQYGVREGAVLEKYRSLSREGSWTA